MLGLRLLIQEYPSITCEKMGIAMLYSHRQWIEFCDRLTRAGLPFR
jgi:hypothetical protein